MALHVSSVVDQQTKLCEPGDFLTRTIQPIYEVVARNMGKYVKLEGDRER